MSRVKFNKISIFVLLAMLTFLLFGCGKQHVAVSSVKFKFEEGEQVVLVVGQSFDLAEYIEVSPSNANNKDYTLTSLDGQVISIDGDKINAIKEGSTYVKLVASDNDSKQDIIKVSVRQEKINLSAPQNLSYNSETQTFSFDQVENASSYTIKINNTEYDLGNSTSFSLNSALYTSEKYDTVLKVQVKANPSKYAFAYNSSIYAGAEDETALEIYHARPVNNTGIKGGVLSFNKSSKIFTTISLQTKGVLNLTSAEKLALLNGGSLENGLMLNSAFADASISLNGLSANLAGKKFYAYVVSNVSKEEKDALSSNVKVFNSLVAVPVNMLDVLELAMADTTISWQALSGVSNYNLYIDGMLKTNIKNNKFDLTSLEDYENYEHSTSPYVLKVEPVIDENSQAVAKTNAETTIKFNRLQAPTISTTQNGIVWTRVENAELYNIVSNYNNLPISLKDTEFSLTDYPSDATYKFTLTASRTEKVEDVYYISSLPETIEVKKLEETQAKIEDYKLKFDTVVGDSYLVEVDLDGTNKYSETITKTDKDSYELNLGDMSKFNFSAGDRSIEITHLGDNNNKTVNSNKDIVRFTQLEAISSLSVADEKTTVSKSTINKNATIVLEIESSVLPEKKIVTLDETLIYAYNTIEENNELLPAGNYIVKVFVKGNGGSAGDGISTFSVRENGVEIPTASTSFTVLPAPTINVLNSAISQFDILAVENAQSYSIYQVLTQDVFRTTQTATAYPVTLDSGETKTYKAQAIGNGSTFLSSCKSDPINITRLLAPTLTFNGKTESAYSEKDKNIFTKQDLNESGLCAGYELKHDSIIVPYVFDGVTSYTDFNVGENVFTLTAKANTKVGGDFYLDSLENKCVLTLTKLNNKATINTNLDNELVIQSTNSDEHGLQVEFDVNGTKTIFAGDNNVLTDGTKNISYTYNSATKSYTLNLVDENHNEIVEGTADNEFSVRVRYVAKSTDNDVFVNSDYSSAQTCSLTKIDETSLIIMNYEDKLLVQPLNLDHDKDYYLRLKFTMGQTSFNFIQTDEETLTGVDNEYSLNYRKETTEGTVVYLIDMFKPNSCDLVVEELEQSETGTFGVQVAYSFNSSGGVTDTDSIYTTPEKTINFVGKVQLARDNQAIAFSDAFYAHNYYYLYINGNVASLPNISATNNVYSIPIKTLYENEQYSQYLVDGVNEIAVITRSSQFTDYTSYISQMSESLYIERAETLTLSTFKESDLVVYNSAYVRINAYDAPYNKRYILQLKDETMRVVLSHSRLGTNTSENLTFALDTNVVNNQDFSDVVNVTAYVEATGSYINNGKTVHVFSSADSQTLSFNILKQPTNVYVSNNRLYFDGVANATGYELYVGNSSTPFNSVLINSTSYDISELSEGAHQLYIKTISAEKDGNGRLFTNSSYANAITIQKLIAPTVTRVNGDFKVTYQSDVNDAFDSGATVKLVIENQQNGTNTTFVLSRVADGQSLSVDIPADRILGYNGTTVSAENLKFKLVVESSALVDDEVFFLNSAETTKIAYGLFAPQQVRKYSNNDEDVSEVEQILWTENVNNTIQGVDEFVVGYEMFVTYKGKTYSTADNKLLYLNGNAYSSYAYPIIGNSAVFPAGYDNDGDGDIDIWFKQGSYEVTVRSVPKINVGTNTETYELYASEKAVPYNFKILSTPTLSTHDGGLLWEQEAGATEYLITLYKNGTPVLTQAERVKATDISDNKFGYYNFSNTAMDGVYGLLEATIKAVSSNEAVLNGETSARYQVYRMPKADNIEIDDGDIVLTAVKYFTTAIIEFKSTSGASQTIYYDNSTNAKEFLKGLGVTDWSNIASVASKLEERQEYYIPAKDLSLPSGGSFVINVTLIGSSSEKLGVVNSEKATNLGSLQAVKISTANVLVTNGELTFSANSGYTAQPVQLNYNFNGQTAKSDFWLDTIIYQITIKSNKEEHVIYAVDYNKFISAVNAGTYLCDYTAKDNTGNENKDVYGIVNMNDLYAYVQYGDLKLNVFKNNILNFANNNRLDYYRIDIATETVTSGNNLLTNYVYSNYEYPQGTSFSTIDLTSIGSFTVDVRMLGGDSAPSADGSINVGYITANDRDLNTFVRYGSNALGSSNGMVRFENKIQTSTEDSTLVLDYPIYRLSITQLNVPDSNTIVYVYTNDLTEIQLQGIASKNDAGVEVLFKRAESVTEEYITFNMSKYFIDGVYIVTVKTLAGVGIGISSEDDYLLNAKGESEQYTFKKLTSTGFTINNSGTLEIERSYVKQDSVSIYSSYYEITLNKLNASNAIEETYTFTINEESEGVEILGSKLTYKIPTSLTIGQKTIRIEEGEKYSIQARALAEEDYVLNGTYKQVATEEATDNSNILIDETLQTYACEFSKTKGVSSVYIKDGQLRWVAKDLTYYESVIINLTYVDKEDGQTKYIVIRDRGTKVELDGVYQYHYYDFGDTSYPIGKESDERTTYTQILSGVDYKLEIIVSGQSRYNLTDSNASTEIVMNRLATVDASSIKSNYNNGCLTWLPVEGAVKYEVVVTAQNGTKNTYYSETNSLDFADISIPVGAYGIKITAIGDDNLTGLTSDEVTGFEKLEQIASVELSGDSIVWTKVASAKGYKVKFVYTNLSGIQVTKEDIVETDILSYAVPTDIRGTFRAYVAPIGEGKVLSGDWNWFETGTNSPLPINDIEFDDSTYTFSWTVGDEFDEDDVLVVEYDFIKATSTGNQTVTVEPIKIAYNGTKEYSFKLEEIGIYSNFSVKVSRAGTAPSAKVYYYESEGIKGVVDFSIYAYGDGIDNPYAISTAQHLLNIKYNPTKSFVLANSIDMSTVDISTQLAENSALICEEFRGTLDGSSQKYEIKNFNKTNTTDAINLQNATNLALFKSLNGATIKNITFGEDNVEMLVTNTFSATTANDVYMSLLATTASYSTIQGVVVKNVKYVLNGDASNATTEVLNGDVYIAGLIAVADNSTMVDCDANVNADINIALNQDKQSYISSIVALSNNTSMSLCGASLSVTTDTYQNIAIDYIGAIVAKANSALDTRKEILQSSASVEITNVKATYVGGIAGFVTNMNLNSCVAEGSISYARANFDLCVGGIAGYAQDVHIVNCSTKIQPSITVANLNNSYLIGAIVGNIAVATSTSKVETCYIYYAFNYSDTVVSMSSYKLGVCGSHDSAVSITVTQKN